jgi:hypothetical protein
MLPAPNLHTIPADALRAIARMCDAVSVASLAAVSRDTASTCVPLAAEARERFLARVRAFWERLAAASVAYGVRTGRGLGPAPAPDGVVEDAMRGFWLDMRAIAETDGWRVGPDGLVEGLGRVEVTCLPFDRHRPVAETLWTTTVDGVGVAVKLTRHGHVTVTSGVLRWYWECWGGYTRSHVQPPRPATREQLRAWADRLRARLEALPRVGPATEWTDAWYATARRAAELEKAELDARRALEAFDPMACLFAEESWECFLRLLAVADFQRPASI